MKKRMKLPQKMRFKILVLCLTCTMTTLLLQTWLFNRKSSTLIYNQAKKESFSLLRNIQDNLFTILKSMENNIIEVYNRQQLVRDLKEKESISLLRDKYYRESYNIATGCFDTSDGVVALYLYNGEDEIISTYRRAVAPRHNYPLDVYEYAEESNADLVRQYAHPGETTMLVSSYLNPYHDTDIIRLVIRLYNNSSTSQVIGHIACDVDSKILRYRMEKFITDGDVSMWLQPVGDRAVISVGSLGENDRELFDGISDHLRRGEQDFSLPAGGSQRVLFQVEQNKCNLSVYALTPQALLAANQRILTASLFTIVAVMLMITLVLTLLWSRSLTRPLEELTEMTDWIKKGETNLRVAIKKHDEIGVLGQSFNEMLDQIEVLLVREYGTKLLLSRAEYNALQAQINPHFLHNTLDTMSSIAQVRHCDEVSHLCQSLSNTFRYSLDMKNPFSTVVKEIVHLKNYIYVMDVRMRNHVAYGFDIDDEVLKDTVPRTCVQPLVENVLNHGLRNMRGEKHVVIRVKVQEDNLIIAMEDNGVGLENAEELNQKMKENDLDLVERGSSIGLINVNAGAETLYGDSYGIRVESAPGTGARVYLTVAGLTMGEVEQ